MQRDPFDLQGTAHQVTRRSGNRRDNRQFVTRQTVEQAGFADVRLPGDHDVQAALQQTALLRAVKHRRQTSLQAIETTEGIRRFKKINFFFGEIERCLGQRAQFGQLIKQGVNFLREVPMQRAYRTLRGSAGRGVDQIGNGFGLCQIKLAVEKGTAGEFTGFGQAGTEFKTAREQHL